MRFLSSIIAVILFVSTNVYGKRENRCSALFDIHLGYNAFINIADYSLGHQPNLRNARTIYDNFPKGNEALRDAALFTINYAVKVNHPPEEKLLSEINSTNGLILSHLSLCSKSIGEIAYRKYYQCLKNNREYDALYYATFILGYPMYWDRNSIREDFPTNATDFISSYDAYLITRKPLTESEQLLYDVFKLEIDYEINQNEDRFLSNLDSLILAHPTYFSVLNYQQFIKEYYPKHTIPLQLANLKKDGFDRDDQNPILKTITIQYNSFEEAVNELELNPFDDFLSNYGNVQKLLPKASFSEVIKQLNRIDTLVNTNKQKCYLSSVGQNLTTQIIDCQDKRFTKSQTALLKAERLKKWVKTHIECKITLAFYMEERLINEWNAMSQETQKELNDYFIKVLEASDNHSYLLKLQEKLKLK